MSFYYIQLFISSGLSDIFSSKKQMTDISELKSLTSLIECVKSSYCSQSVMLSEGDTLLIFSSQSLLCPLSRAAETCRPYYPSVCLCGINQSSHTVQRSCYHGVWFCCGKSLPAPPSLIPSLCTRANHVEAESSVNKRL